MHLTRPSNVLTSPFDLRGIIEGFYGPPYTFPQRRDLIRWAGAHGFNLYLYAPKNDRQGRSRWWEPYPAKIMHSFAETIGAAADAGIAFAYAVSPGNSISYASPGDFTRLQAKLRTFYDLGVRTFALLLDDITPGFNHQADRAGFGSYAGAQAALANATLNWLRSLDPICRLFFCPVDYYGRAPFGRDLAELGEQLDRGIDIFYTGQEICSPSIAAADADAFAGVIRRPPLIWDNYPVNDLMMRAEMHIGPVRGRDAALAERTRGILVNAMVQPEASKIPLLTYARFLADPSSYDPDAAWEEALRAIGGDERYADLRLFAENSLFSCLGVPEAERMERLVREALAELVGGTAPSHSSAVSALDGYLAELDEARYRLMNWLDNLALRNDLLLWLEMLDLWCWMAKRALAVLYALERGQPYQAPLTLMRQWLTAIRQYPYRVTGFSLLALAEYVEEWCSVL